MDGDDVFHAVSKGRYFLGCEYGESSGFKPYNTNIFGTPVIFSNKVMNPLRFMPKKKIENQQERGPILKRCARCMHEYVNTTLDRCDLNFCGGELVLVKASAMGYAGSSASSSDNERKIVGALSAASKNL